MRMKLHNSNKFGQLTENVVIDFEHFFEISLPKEYRNFLLENNGGEPVPGFEFFWIKKGKDGSSVHQYFGLHNGPIHLQLNTYMDQSIFGFPRSLLPVADDGMGNFICVGIQENNYGKVYFLDHDLFPFQSNENAPGITQLSSSFSSFINALKEDPIDN